jgi:hypothetical protein
MTNLDRLKYLKDYSGLNWRKLADLSGVSHQQMRTWGCGARTVPPDFLAYLEALIYEQSDASSD